MVGTAKLDTLCLALRYGGLSVEQGRVHLSVVNSTVERVQEVLSTLTEAVPPAQSLTFLTNKLRVDKYDDLIPDDLLRQAFIRDSLELDSLRGIAGLLSGGAE